MDGSTKLDDYSNFSCASRSGAQKNIIESPGWLAGQNNHTCQAEACRSLATFVIHWCFHSSIWLRIAAFLLATQAFWKVKDVKWTMKIKFHRNSLSLAESMMDVYGLLSFVVVSFNFSSYPILYFYHRRASLDATFPTFSDWCSVLISSHWFPFVPML